MNEHDTLTAYAALRSLVARMRDAAEREDWAQLAAYEPEMQRQSSLLMGAPALTQPEAQGEQLAHIQSIMRDDAAIRARVSPYMDKLCKLIQQSGTHRRSVNAYRQTPPV